MAGSGSSRRDLGPLRRQLPLAVALGVAVAGGNALVPLPGALQALQGSAVARALELSGSTLFVKAPWKVDLITYTSTVGQPQPEYYVTLELEPDAGASLGRFSFQQIRGADWQFPFSPQRTRAFLGRPRREGRPVPVQANWDQESRTMQVTFPEPIPPGSTITTVLIPWFNPMQSDTYLFQVEAFPAGPNPVGSPVGVGTLRIYQNTYW